MKLEFCLDFWLQFGAWAGEGKGDTNEFGKAIGFAPVLCVLVA